LQTALPNDPEDLLLRFYRNRPEFIQEQRTAVRSFESPRPRLEGTGECTFLMAEKLSLDQRRGKSGTIQSHQGTVPPMGQVMKPCRGQLLAGASFSDQQNRPFDRGDFR
jgi:hypothetical protein